MKNVKVLLAILNILRLLPHIILYLRFRARLDNDIERNSIGGGKTCFELFVLLVFCKQFRDLFYYRVEKWKYLCLCVLPMLLS